MAGDVTKLPKWAQRRIQKLERDLEHERKRLMVGLEGSDTVADPYSEPPRGLGESPTVRFYLDGRDYIDVHRMLDHEKRASVIVSGADCVQVEPRASNSLRVRVAR